MPIEATFTRPRNSGVERPIQVIDIVGPIREHISRTPPQGAAQQSPESPIEHDGRVRQPLPGRAVADGHPDRHPDDQRDGIAKNSVRANPDQDGKHDASEPAPVLVSELARQA